ncbi:MAG: calcium-binding protein, partial [Bacillota bacterium]
MTSIVNPESTELVVSDGVHGNGQYGFTYPDAITLTDGNILAYGTSQFGIIARILAPDGTALTGDIQLATSGGYHDVVALPGGGWAMAYEIPGDSTDIAFQIFDPTGQPIGSEIQVTGRQAGYQVDPQVALLADGNIVVSWLSGGSEVGQIYDTAGNTDGSAFTMRADGVEAPDIAATPDGGFVAVWVDHSGTFAPGGGTVIVGERFNADGTPNGGMFQIGQATLYGEMDPSVTVLADGSIAVAFRHAAIANLGHGDVLAVDIWARVIHPDGTTDPIIAVTHPTETDVNHSERGDEYPEIVALPDGGFAIGFTSVNDLGGYGEREYYVATFDADGNRVTGNQLASSDGESLGVFAGITALEDGSVVAVWGNGGAHGRIFGPTDLSDIVINGDGADNALTGSSANETLNGGAGNDQLDGGTGVDLMRGGHGNDSYFVDDSRESVIEDSINGGDDTVTASASWHLAEGLYVEHLVAAPGTAPIYLTGNAYDQSLQGNAGDNILDGGGGDDSFAGGAGNDVYIILGDRNYGVSLPANVVTENANEGTDEVRVRIGNYTLGINVENLTGIGDLAQILTGNELNNVITGGYQDSLNGLAGNDTLVRTDGYGTMAGGTGDDIYILAPWGGGGEQVVENAGEGTDEVRVSEGPYTLAANVENLTGTGSAGQQLTGNELDNRIVGGSGNDNIQGMDGNDFIDGGAGNDSMTGGAGDDTYVVASALDVVVEDVGGGVDTVQAKLSWTLGANLENLTLTGSLALSGTGNALDNVLRGNRGGNTLAGLDGDDTLDGGLGDDVLDGGAGRDAASYASAAMGVTVSLAIGGAQNTVGAGTDTLVGIENLTGSSYADTLTGDGNANLLTGAAGADTLVGGSGNDTLMGGSGADTLRGGVGDDVLAGGAGNDVYYVESAGDSVVENSGEGIDSVHSSIGWTLSANVE